MKNIYITITIFLIAISLYAQTPELVVQKGHGSKITCFAFSPDGKFIVSGSMDYTIKLWDIQTGKEVRSFVGHKGNVNSVIISDNGKYVLSTSSDKLIKLWDSESGKEIRTFSGHSERVLNAIFNSNSSQIISGSDDNVIKFWDTETGKEIRSVAGRKTYVESVDISPDGKSALSGSKDNKIRLVDLNSGEITKSFQGKYGVLGYLTFSKDGKYALSGDGVDMVLWDIEKQQNVKNFKGHNNTVNYVSFSNDGKLGLSVCAQENKFNIWEIESGKLLKSVVSDGVYSAIFSTDNKFVLTGQITELGAGVLKLWNAQKGTEVRTFAGYAGSITSLNFFPDGKSFISTSGFGTNSIKKWSLSPNIDLESVTDISKTALCVAISSDGNFVAIGNSDNTISVYDKTCREELFSLGGHKLAVKSLIFTNDNKYLISGSLDNTIKVWSMDEKRESFSMIGFSNSLSISNNNQLILSGNDDLIRVFDVNTQKKIQTLKGHSDTILSVSASTDGKSAVSAGLDGTLKLWDLQSGTLIKELIKISNTINSVLFLEDGNTIFSGYGDGNIAKWDLNNQSVTENYTSHTQGVNNILLSPRKDRLLTSSLDKSIKIWDLNTNKELITTIAVGENNYICATPDNYYMATKGGYKGVAFRVGNKVYTFEQFDIQYNRPDIVLERLGYAPKELIDSYRKAYLKRLKKLNFNENMFRNDFHVPEIKSASENIPLSTTDKSVKFMVDAKDTKYNLDRLNVYVNDIPIYGSNGINLRDKNTNKFSSEINIDLTNGRNKIQTSVLNDKGVESLKETVEINYEGKVDKPNLYIVAIGCSDYNDPTYKLNYAAKDANDIVNLFESNKALYGEIKSLKLLDKNVTKENIIKAKEFLMQTRPDDEVIVFVAGHGLLNSNYDYYYATVDIDFKSPEAKGLPYEEIENLLDGIPARMKLLFMDTCHSGEVDKDDIQEIVSTKTQQGEVTFRAVGDKEYTSKEEQSNSGFGLKNTTQLLQEMFVDLRRGSGAIVISSAGGMEFAWEGGDYKNGLFTYSLIEGLNQGKADKNGDGNITVTELRDYVSTNVEILTKGKQKPTARRENVEFDFKVW